MAEDLFVDVRYHGLELGRRARIEEFAAAGAYLHHPAPMPVGAHLLIEADGAIEIAVRVTRVNEQVSGSERPAGMFIEPEDLAGSGKDWWEARVAAASSPAAFDESANTEEMAAAVPYENIEEPVRDTEEMAAPAPDPEAASEAAAPEVEDTDEQQKKKKRGRRKKAK